MSYDLRLAVPVKGAEKDGKDRYAIIAEPEYCSPTYNLGRMFRACMNWNFDQGVFYPVKAVLPQIERGIHELQFNRQAYEQYTPESGWGSAGGALKCLESLLKCIEEHTEGSSNSWNAFPLELLYLAW